MAIYNFGRPENGMTPLVCLPESARGRIITAILIVCADKDECNTGQHDCDDNAGCFNIPGSYECECNEGFAGSGQECDGMYANSHIMFHLDLFPQVRFFARLLLESFCEKSKPI